MTRSRYTPQMVVATLCVLLLPAVAVSRLHANGSVTSFWVCVPIALGLTFLALTLGTTYWRRRRPPATVLFSNLMIWVWIRDRYLDHRLAAALHSLDRLGPGESQRRKQVLTEIAAAVDAKDPFLTGHSQRVARYVAGVARRMHVEREEADRIRTAALLHDVGKLHTPAGILMHPGSLSAQDTAVMRRHAEDGSEMVTALGDPSLADIVRHHHERFDGAGYPSRLAGDSIPLGARIIAVPDTFDAIASPRPYRSAMPHQTALDVLRSEAGAQFDPDVVRAFIAEYTNRRGVMLWAIGQQLAPAARVAGVAAAAIVLNAFTFMASAPSSVTPASRPLARGSVAQNAPTPGTRAPTPTRQTDAQERSPARTPHGGRGRSATATRPRSRSTAPGQPAAVAPAPANAVAHAAPDTRAAQPVNQQQRDRSQTPPVALTPQASASFRSIGIAIAQGASVLTAPPSSRTGPVQPTQPTPGTAPGQPTQPPTPAAPPTVTSPPTTTSPTTPSPPDNADQCKNDGWKSLGFENQGQCIASLHKG